MDKYLLHSHTTEHNYKKELEYMQRHAWKKPETKVYTLIPHIYNFLENNTCYKKQETDWWFPGTGGEKGGLSVKDKVISGEGGEGDENVLYFHCGGVTQLICQKSANLTLKRVYLLYAFLNKPNLKMGSYPI